MSALRIARPGIAGVRLVDLGPEKPYRPVGRHDARPANPVGHMVRVISVGTIATSRVIAEKAV